MHCSGARRMFLDCDRVLMHERQRQTLSRLMSGMGFQLPDRVKVAPEVETSSCAVMSRYPFRPCNEAW